MGKHEVDFVESSGQLARLASMSNDKPSCETCDDQGEMYHNNGDVSGASTTAHPCPDCVVFILTYEHKHGSDVSAYRTRKGAVDAAYGLAAGRVEEDRWEDDGARAKFEAFEDLEEALGYFHEVELEWNYSESLEITESQLGD